MAEPYTKDTLTSSPHACLWASHTIVSPKVKLSLGSENRSIAGGFDYSFESTKLSYGCIVDPIIKLAIPTPLLRHKEKLSAPEILRTFYQDEVSHDSLHQCTPHPCTGILVKYTSPMADPSSEVQEGIKPLASIIPCVEPKDISVYEDFCVLLHRHGKRALIDESQWYLSLEATARSLNNAINADCEWLWQGPLQANQTSKQRNQWALSYAEACRYGFIWGLSQLMPRDNSDFSMIAREIPSPRRLPGKILPSEMEDWGSKHHPELRMRGEPAPIPSETLAEKFSLYCPELRRWFDECNRERAA